MITFIHIGKCGGETVEYYLKGKINSIHCRSVNFDSNQKYLLLLRNPIERFISAFYWRRFLLLSGKQFENKELEFYKEYQDLNVLCKNLFDENSKLNTLIDSKIHQHYTCGHPSHIGMGIDYYIGGIVKKLNPENVIGTICTETLSQDMQRLFGIEVTKHFKKNSSNKIKTTQQSRSILKRYLIKDYQCIEQLYLSNVLPEDQYSILKV